jgi:ATP-dependent Clp protease ATP-binding subunit ClpC
MPKINVYLPDELAEAVKEAGLPVSAVCQRALEQAVRRVTAIREAVVGELELDDPAGRMGHFTARARAVFKLALERARERGAAAIGTEDLLAAMLAEGNNLALHVLRAMEIDPEVVGRDLARQLPDRPEASGDEAVRRFSGPAANALEFAVTEAQTLGHNYIGCEHLLLGLVAEPDGTAGQVLRTRGAEARLTRRAVVAALAGYVHLRAQTQSPQTQSPQTQSPQTQGAQAPGMDATAQEGVLARIGELVRQELRPLAERIERLEQHAGITGPEA